LAQRSRKRGRHRKPRTQPPARRPEATPGGTIPAGTTAGGATSGATTSGAATPSKPTPGATTSGAATPSKPTPGATTASKAAPGEPTAGDATAGETGTKTTPPPDMIGGWRVEPRMTRSQRRDAEVRAGLTPIEPGERPGVIVVSTIVAALIGGGNLVAWLAGVKIDGKHPAASGIFIFSAVMIADAIGMWRLWYGAVLGFMALLAIVGTIFALLLIEASNLLGVVVGLFVIGGAGYLFFKLVRVLSRIQMPRYPGR
jgi:hypothetical protein